MNERTNFWFFKIEISCWQPFSLMDEVGRLMYVNWQIGCKSILFYSIAESILYKFIRHK
jgi:hypothetical protein